MGKRVKLGVYLNKKYGILLIEAVKGTPEYYVIIGKNFCYCLHRISVRFQYLRNKEHSFIGSF